MMGTGHLNSPQLRFRDVKWFDQGHMASLQQSQDFNPKVYSFNNTAVLF